MTRSDVLVGRQPIFDGHRQVLGYELVLSSEPDAERAGDGGPDPDVDPTSADRYLLTSAVVFGSLEFGVDRFVGDKLLFCDASEDLLTGETTPLLPPERTVLEVPTGSVFGFDSAATVGPVCHRLVREGYTLALDDFRWFDGAEEMLPLFRFVKVDRRRFDADAVAAVVEGCRPFDTRVVVHPVDSDRTLREAEDRGADLYQGYLLLTPDPVAGRVLDPGQLTRLRLAARLLDPETGITDIESIVRADPALSLQLLHIAAIGPPGGMRRTVGTVREALVLVGWRRLQSWLSLLLFSGGGGLSTEVMTSALVRARMCELLSARVAGGHSEMAFTAGMLSILDVLLGVPLQDVLCQLPLADDVREAVVSHAGPIGTVLADVIDYQFGSPETARRSGLTYAALQSACFDALAWSIELTTGLDASILV